MMEYGMSIIRKESGMGIAGMCSHWSPLPLTAKLFHLTKPRHFDVQTHEVVELRFYLASVVNLCNIIVE